MERRILNLNQNPAGSDVCFLNAVMDRCEAILSLFTQQTGERPGGGLASEVLLDVRLLLDAIVAHERFPCSESVQCWARACLLASRVEGHSLWPAGSPGAADGAPVFSQVLDGVLRDSESEMVAARENAPEAEEMIRAAFRGSLRFAVSSQFKGVVGWRAAVFVNDVIAEDGNEAWLTNGSDLLLTLAALFYGEHAARSDGRTADFLTDDTKATVFRLAAAASRDSQIVDVAARYPIILENQNVLARLQKAELGELIDASPARRSPSAL